MGIITIRQRIAATEAMARALRQKLDELTEKICKEKIESLKK